MDEAGAIEIPATVKRLLGLDEEPTWIVLTEVNDFIWPGPDLVPVPRAGEQRLDYGVLPPSFFRKVRDHIVALIKARRDDFCNLVKISPRGLLLASHKALNRAGRAISAVRPWLPNSADRDAEVNDAFT